MENLLIFLLEASVAAILLYLCIRLLMERETQHEYVRFLWITAMLLTVILPFIQVPVPDIFPDRNDGMTTGNVIEMAGTGTLQTGTGSGAEGRTFDWMLLCGIIYLAGAAVTLAAYIIANAMTARKIGRIPESREYDSLLERCKEAAGYRQVVRLHLTDDNKVCPYSWMGHIVVCRKDMEEDGKDILLHELGHIAKGHSWDVLLAEAFTCLLWFNPVSWLIQHSLRQIHEFSADRTVLQSGTDTREYQRLLIRKAAGTAFQSIANSFNHSNLKNRITMMSQNQNKRGAFAKSLMLLPMLACIIFVFSTCGRQNDAGKNAEQPQNGIMLSSGETEKYATVNAETFSKWANTMIPYPEEVKNDRKAGMVMARFTVTPQGKTDDIEIITSPDSRLSAVIKDVISRSPQWEPVTVDGKAVSATFTFPVFFSLKVTAPDGSSTNLGDDSEGVAADLEPVFVLAWVK